ncbi:hypothetical protein HDU81_000804 [Chytriomyces hyalinus]|nr:hypothetical protein HDU81_000804 [Chytriomyces hyalinus]
MDTEHVVGYCDIVGSLMRVRRTPYTTGELILVRIRPNKERNGFEGTLISSSTSAPYIAISHLWFSSSVEDRIATDAEISWTVVHDVSTTAPLNECLTALCDQSETNEVVVWLDFLCLPQAIVFPKEVFASMSSVYGASERCVMVPICDSTALENWDGMFEKLRISVVEAERNTRCAEWLVLATSKDDICSSSFAVDIKRIVDPIRKSYVSDDGWMGMGHVPYKFMRDALLLLQLANAILQSEYFFRVWTFQEIILPEQLYMSFGRYGAKNRSNIVDADAFINATNMAMAALGSIHKQISDAHEHSAPYQAFRAAATIIMDKIRAQLKLLEDGRNLGRTAKLEAARHQLSPRYVEDVLRIFSSAPRKARFARDFVFGLLGLIKVDMEQDDSSTEMVVRRFLAQISRNTRRVWVSGGFIKLMNPYANWWVSSVPREVQNSTFLRGSKAICDFDPTKPLGDTFGTVYKAKNMDIKSNFSLVVGAPDLVDGETTFRLKHVVCSEHQSAVVLNKPEQLGVDVIELTSFLAALIMRFGRGKDPFRALVRAILGLEANISESDSRIRREMHHHLNSIDEDESADSYMHGGAVPTNLVVTQTELSALFRTTATQATLRCAVDVVCGCKFGCPDNLFKRLLAVRLPQVLPLLNLSAMQMREERLIICEVELDVKTDLLAKYLPDPDKPKHNASMEGRDDSKNASAAEERSLRKLRSVKLFLSVEGFLVSLRDEKSGPMRPKLNNVELVERGRRVYAARSSVHELSGYQPLGLFVFKTDIYKLVEKQRAVQDAETKAEGDAAAGQNGNAGNDGNANGTTNGGDGGVAKAGPSPKSGEGSKSPTRAPTTASASSAASPRKLDG